jgi:hypothetical protein
MAGGASVLAAVWCRSVGTSWTLELHRLRRGTAPLTLLDWISSGVPITESQPPEVLARELLGQRGLHLFRDSTAGPATGSRRGVGYVTADAELISLVHLVHDDATQAGLPPVTLAARWVAAGYSADTAARWIRQGAHFPPAAREHRAPSQPTPSLTPPSMATTPLA